MTSDLQTLQPLMPFGLQFAETPSLIRGNETGGALTKGQTSKDGIVEDDEEEDADVDK